LHLPSVSAAGRISSGPAVLCRHVACNSDDLAGEFVIRLRIVSGVSNDFDADGSLTDVEAVRASCSGLFSDPTISLKFAFAFEKIDSCSAQPDGELNEPGRLATCSRGGLRLKFFIVSPPKRDPP
jgi:hypothetical protein